MEKVRLGDVCTINGGYTFKSDQFSTEGVPVIRIGNITKEGLIIDEDVCYDEKFWNENDSYRIAENDILIAMSGATVGKSCINNTERKLLLNQRVAAINCDNNINLKYIFYSIDSEKFSKYIMTNSIGCAQPNISLKQIANFEISAVCLEEQNRIADELDKVTDVINKRKQQISKLDELVKARFVELFGDPVSNPMGWKKEQLQSNATLLNGRAYKQDELLDSGKYPVLRVGNFFSNRSWYYSDLELEADKYCDNGDLLYAWSASFGPRIWSGGKVIYHYHIWKVLVGEKYNKKFLCNLLDYVTASLMGDTHGIGMMHLTKSGMEETEFIVPPIDLQNQFAAFVEQTDKSKLEVQKSLEKMELLKKALMQKYFE